MQCQCPVGGKIQSYPNLYSLINDIVNGIIPQPSTDGMIWIAQGADNSPNNIVIDGSMLGMLTTTRLTLQGGWDGGYSARYLDAV